MFTKVRDFDPWPVEAMQGKGCFNRCCQPKLGEGYEDRPDSGSKVSG